MKVKSRKSCDGRMVRVRRGRHSARSPDSSPRALVGHASHRARELHGAFAAALPAGPQDRSTPRRLSRP